MFWQRASAKTGLDLLTACDYSAFLGMVLMYWTIVILGGIWWNSAVGNATAGVSNGDSVYND